MRVFAYFNLHKRLYSIKALEGPDKGRVVAHRASLLIRDATLKVSEAGRQRVIRERCKNVHAGVCGTWHDEQATADAVAIIGNAVMYNPYKYSTFVMMVNEQPVTHAELVALTLNKGKASMHVCL